MSTLTQVKEEILNLARCKAANLPLFQAQFRVQSTLGERRPVSRNEGPQA